MRNLTLDEVFEEVADGEADPLNRQLGSVSVSQLLAAHSATLQEAVVLSIQEEEEEFDGGDNDYF